jgi:hypothetical protein
MEIFKIRGRYDDNLGLEAATNVESSDYKSEDHLTDGPRASTKDLLAKFRELETPPATQIKGVSSGDAIDAGTHRPNLLDDELPPQDTARNMAAKWKAMEAATGPAPTPTSSIQMQKKSREGNVVTSNVRVPVHGALAATSDNGDRSHEGLSDTPTHATGDHHAGGADVSENTPDATAEGVVRSEIGEIRSEEMPQSGITRSLLARFQQAQ